MSSPGWLKDVARVDMTLYATVACTPTPTLDQTMSSVTWAANYSRLSIAAALALALAGGPGGRLAARDGLASIAVTSSVVNLALKPLGRRRRPRPPDSFPAARHVAMPTSSSFPSGHAAAAFAFATGAGRTLPWTAAPLRALAAVVGYSRVHTGVHYPSDVIIGSLLGSVLAQATTRALHRRR